jgi:hypothetical protein
VYACIYVHHDSSEIVPLQEKKWSISEFTRSESFKATQQSSADEEKLLEFGNVEKQLNLAKCVKELKFLESPSKLPKSVLQAICNRFTYDQVMKHSSMNFTNHRPSFASGSMMFPAFAVSKTPGLTLESFVSQVTPATLRGYNRHAVRGRDWQALWPSEEPTDQVKGFIYFNTGITVSARYEVKGATAEIELANGNKLDLEVTVHVWNGKLDDLLPTTEKTWSPSTLLNSPYYKMIAMASEAAEDRLAFDEAFRNFQKLDDLWSMQVG